MRRLLLLGAIAACGRIDFVPLSDSDMTAGACSNWSVPTVVPGTEALANPRGSAIAPDGLSIIWVDYVSGPGSLNYQTRTSRTEPFGAPQLVPNTPAMTYEGHLVAGARTLIVADAAAPGCPFQLDATVPFQFSNVPLELSVGCAIALRGPSLTPDGLAVYATDNSTTLRFSRRASLQVPFPTAIDVPEIGVPVGYPAIRADELELFFENSVAGSTDLWHVTRATVADPWSAPELVPVVNSDARDEDVSITSDGLELYFDSNREGPHRLYVATRTCP